MASLFSPGAVGDLRVIWRCRGPPGALLSMGFTSAEGPGMLAEALPRTRARRALLQYARNVC